MSILQQSPVIETKKVSVNSHPGARVNADEEPRLPAGWYEDSLAAVRNRQPFSPEHIAIRKQYEAEHRAWEDRMEARGRGYSPSTVVSLVDGGEQVLMDYLRQTGAPAEIIDIARWLPTAAVVKYRFFFNWQKIDRFNAVHVGQFVPALRAAIKSIRYFLDAAKPQ
jgi:hypothetical protein